MSWRGFAFVLNTGYFPFLNGISPYGGKIQAISRLVLVNFLICTENVKT